MLYAFVYILASRPYGTLYVGVTSDLVQRVRQHKGTFVEGFTRTHGARRLVWYECHESMPEAVSREKRIKSWHRDCKINLSQAMNPDWIDLYDGLCA